MGREHEPTAKQWYRDLEADETFQVLSVDEDEELVEIQHLDGDVEEIDLDTWSEMDLELADEPEGWSESDEDDEDFEEDEEDDEDDEDDDWDEDDDEDDDWDDDDEDSDDYRNRDDY